MAEIIETQPELPLAGTHPAVSRADSGEVPPWKEIPQGDAATNGSEKPDGQDNGESATPGQSEPESPDKPEVDPVVEAKRAQRRLERRMDKLHRQRAEAQARAEQAERRLQELEKPRTPYGTPTLEQFDYDPEKYAEAVTKFARDQAAKETQSKHQQEQATRQRAELISKWEEKVEVASDKYEDFTTIVGNLEPNVPFIAAIMDADNGPDIAYHIAKNPDLANRLISMPLFQQIREIGKLEATLAAQPKKELKPSKAPAPIEPVSGTGAPSSAEPSESDSYEVWLKKRRAQLRARGR